MNENAKWIIPESEITSKVTNATVEFAQEFGQYLCTDYPGFKNTKLTTSQLRKFFGEVKRQQMTGYNETDFVLLKPKLAYAVGRAKKNSKNPIKIEKFYETIADAIDKVKNDEGNFKRFIKIFEAIVAYHKKAEAEN